MTLTSSPLWSRRIRVTLALASPAFLPFGCLLRLSGGLRGAVCVYIKESILTSWYLSTPYTPYSTNLWKSDEIGLDVRDGVNVGVATSQRCSSRLRGIR